MGEPGTPEFLAAYQAAHEKRRKAPDPDRFHSIISGYKASAEFAKLRDRTRADYLKIIARIEARFGTLPLAAFDEPKVTRVLLDWRAQAFASAKWQDYAWTVLMRVISWARQGGLTTFRPPERVERLYHADRAQQVWSERDIAAFLAKASEPLQRAMVLAIETGQRQADLLALTWGNYDGETIRLRQQKTGVRVVVPVSSTLRRVLDAIPRTGVLTILQNGRGRPWQGTAFRKAWGGAAKAAGIDGLTFHDLRGTAVTRLAEAGCTPAEIASLTGHSLRDAGAILERYTARTDKLAFAAIAKLERRVS